MLHLLDRPIGDHSKWSIINLLWQQLKLITIKNKSSNWMG